MEINRFVLSKTLAYSMNLLGAIIYVEWPAIYMFNCSKELPFSINGPLGPAP